MSNEEKEETFDARCKSLRKDVKHVGEDVKSLLTHSVFGPHTMRMLSPSEVSALASMPKRDDMEMRENVVLAHRHLEDAAMRLGKAIQAYDGGVSVYDK